ncbi:rluD [Symbiodinium sp. CCMP2592]|nr:rluD [Symbiodinium sp. CCMP2592]
MADLKITEKTTLAYQKFMAEADKHVQKMRQSWQMEEFHEKCRNEYEKLFGRVGLRPLENIRGGKPKPRYLIDRDEVWVIYKPPLWQMGGSPDTWNPQLRKEFLPCKTKQEALQKIWEHKKSCLQMWHGLACGTQWVGEDDGKIDPQARQIKDWGFIQRLDLETDGPVIVAKTWRAQRFLQVQLKEHIFSKAYICLVHGKVENRTQYVEAKFAELGGGRESAIMVKHDKVHDPFFTKQQQGWWKGRDVRMAKTFFKPLAYYRKESDGSEYSLVYVNILSGITHQVRITMRSVGHPLVSDDRYLPTNVAVEDADWCPRNFLVEVRSDWFDMCGPYPDRKRRAFTRISVENPLPKLFQDVLEKKLKLTEKLDAEADLFLGCKYWALGDEMLMADFPKDAEYRKKVMRWGIRRKIHLDALDRMLLLSREEIDRIMTEYKPPAEDEAIWVCPLCMSLNQKDNWNDGYHCKGYVGQSCHGTLKMSEDTKLPHGWRDYLADPTLHMLKKVNLAWLEARKHAIQKRRAVWSKPPEEEDGEEPSRELIEKLHEVLYKDAESGGYGIEQKDLAQKVKGFETLRMPVKLPKDCEVRRVRLPGRGIGSAWTYTLSGKERLKAASNFSCHPKFLKKPILVETDRFPQKNVAPKEEVEEVVEEPLPVPLESRKHKRSEDNDWQARQWGSDAESRKRKDRSEAPEAATAYTPREGRPRKWQRIMRSDRTAYYLDVDTGEMQDNMPADYQEQPPVWERVVSRSNSNHVYYHNTDTGETRVERPEGVKIKNDAEVRSAAAAAPASRPAEKDEEGIPWERHEAKSKPGFFYYFNPLDGTQEIKPPVVKAPWQLLRSKSMSGQYYYFNQVTGESTEIPPRCALPQKAMPGQLSQPSPARSTASAPLESSPAGRPGALARPSSKPNVATSQDDPLPDGWERLPSTHYKDKFYYRKIGTEETQWERPTVPHPPRADGREWERRASTSQPGKFYWFNARTNQTLWDEG